MSDTTGGVWPAQVIHVNEDGWVLVNRGSRQGVLPGLHLLVVASGARALCDTTRSDAGQAPVVLRLRRTFELLEVIYANAESAIAIAARVPVERRPTVYAGTDGEVMVWVPLAPDYIYPQETDTDADSDDADDADDADDMSQPTSADASASSNVDPEGSVDQQDPLWEQALPLNGVNVGDEVLLAKPASAPSTTSATGPGATDSAPSTSSTPGTPGTSGGYDWMKL